jgi:hypothetical protein
MLTEADDGLPAPQLLEITAAVLRRARRRAQMRLLCGVGALLMAVTLVFTVQIRSRRHVPVSADDRHLRQRAILSPELLSLNREADFHLGMARSLQAIETTSSLRRREIAKAAKPDLTEKLSELREQSGRILLREATAEDNLAIYREIVQFFPDTSAGRKARGRLQNGRT